MPTEMKLLNVLGHQIGLILVDLACASVQFTVFRFYSYANFESAGLCG